MAFFRCGSSVSSIDVIGVFANDSTGSGSLTVNASKDINKLFFIVTMIDNGGLSASDAPAVTINGNSAVFNTNNNYSKKSANATTFLGYVENVKSGDSVVCSFSAASGSGILSIAAIG